MSEFVTCLNCMDGRVQKVMIDWLESNYNAVYVDMITEAGMDGFIVKKDELPESLRAKIDISLQKHGSTQIFIVGHHDCGGHPVDEKTHREHIKAAVEKVSQNYPGYSVTGVWISEKWQAEKTMEVS